jgi:hypothetical protein
MAEAVLMIRFPDDPIAPPPLPVAEAPPLTHAAQFVWVIFAAFLCDLCGLSLRSLRLKASPDNMR